MDPIGRKAPSAIPFNSPMLPVVPKVAENTRGLGRLH